MERTWSPCHLVNVCIILSPCHLINWSPCHIVTIAPGRHITLSPYHIETLSRCHLMTWSALYLATLSPYHLLNLSPCQVGHVATGYPCRVLRNNTAADILSSFHCSFANQSSHNIRYAVFSPSTLLACHTINFSSSGQLVTWWNWLIVNAMRQTTFSSCHHVILTPCHRLAWWRCRLFISLSSTM